MPPPRHHPLRVKAKSKSPGLTLLFLLGLLLSAAPWAEEGPVSAHLCEGQARLQHGFSSELLHPNPVFAYDRSLADYGSHFDLFELYLGSKRGGLWFDSGAGTARAQLQHLQTHRIKAVAKGVLAMSHYVALDLRAPAAVAQRKLSFLQRLRRISQFFQNNPEASSLPPYVLRPEPAHDIAFMQREYPQFFTFISGDYLENLYLDGVLDKYKAEVDFLSDLHGPSAYSRDLVRVWNIYFDLLKVDGLFVDLIMDRRNDPEEVYVNEFFSMATGLKLEFPDVLRFLIARTPGLELKEGFPRLSKVHIWDSEKGFLFEENWDIRIRKTAPGARIDPRLLRPDPEFFVDGRPPQRRFWLDDR